MLSDFPWLSIMRVLTNGLLRLLRDIRIDRILHKIHQQKSSLALLANSFIYERKNFVDDGHDIKITYLPLDIVLYRQRQYQ